MHDARGGSLRGAHAVAEQDDDVLDLGAQRRREGHDLEIARGKHLLAVGLRGLHTELVRAGGIAADRAHGGDDGFGRQALDATGRAVTQGDRGAHGLAVDQETCRHDLLTGIRFDRGLEVKALARKEARNDRRIAPAGEQLARRRQAGDRRRGQRGPGQQGKEKSGGVSHGRVLNADEGGLLMAGRRARPRRDTGAATSRGRKRPRRGRTRDARSA
mmetsp:Transcript_61164/g.144499  ORF Transcript_61164/g.144499 Transcript_61164/m.144499 type:complete len:216 (-) Transcript_61164:1795-2442(-)